MNVHTIFTPHQLDVTLPPQSNPLPRCEHHVGRPVRRLVVHLWLVRGDEGPVPALGIHGVFWRRIEGCRIHVHRTHADVSARGQSCLTNSFPSPFLRLLLLDLLVGEGLVILLALADLFRLLLHLSLLHLLGTLLHVVHPGVRRCLSTSGNFCKKPEGLLAASRLALDMFGFHKHGCRGGFGSSSQKQNNSISGRDKIKEQSEGYLRLNFDMPRSCSRVLFHSA